MKSRRELGCGPSTTASTPVTDPIAVIEAAYSLAGDERDWLLQLGEAFRSNTGDDRWAVVSTGESGARWVARSMACLGAEHDAVLASGNELFSALGDPEALSHLRRVPFVCTLRQLPERLRREGVMEAKVRAFESNIERWLRKWEMGDELWVNAQDTTGVSCCFFAPMRRSGPLWPREAHKWRCIAAHVATAFRVRRQFAGGVPATIERTARSAEAVLDPGGRLLHAEAPAKGDTLRERQVLAYAKLGLPNKIIAYEFGLSLSTVSTHLARARTKLQSSLGAAVR